MPVLDKDRVVDHPGLGSGSVEHRHEVSRRKQPRQFARFVYYRQVPHARDRVRIVHAHLARDGR
jgi:plasmid stabilization system protein ParE